MLDPYKLQEAWSAFSSNENKPGIRSILLFSSNKRNYYAAMSYPDNAESIMIEVSKDISIPKSIDSLGFSITCTCLPNQKNVVVVTRSEDANFDIFYSMCIDLIDCVSNSEDSSTVISRLIAWKNFMKTPDNYLSPSREKGLFGELVILNVLMDSCVSHSALLNSWVGPLRGLHDFEFSNFALEVKSTTKDSNCAQITSLEQLDVAPNSSLYLSLVKLKKCSDAGQTLDDLVLSTLTKLESSLKPDFYNKLLLCGYMPSFQSSRPCKSRYKVNECHYYHVDHSFPCLKAGTVPMQIRNVSYELDLTYQAEVTSKTIENLLEG